MGDRNYASINIRHAAYQNFRDYCKREGLVMLAVVEKLLDKYVKENDINKENNTR